MDGNDTKMVKWTRRVFNRTDLYVFGFLHSVVDRVGSTFIMVPCNRSRWNGRRRQRWDGTVTGQTSGLPSFFHTSAEQFQYLRSLVILFYYSCSYHHVTGASYKYDSTFVHRLICGNYTNVSCYLSHLAVHIFQTFQLLPNRSCVVCT